MTDETTTEQLAEIEGQGDTVQVREGRWRTRGGEEIPVTAMPTDHVDFSPGYPWWCGDRTWSNNGNYSVYKNAMDLVEYLGPIQPDKTQELETKTQELETKTQELPEYTPPEGWRVVRFGELLQPGDVWVNQDGTERRSAILHWDAAAVSGGRCIRRIKPQAQPEPNAATIEELRSEVSYVQRLLGESRQRVTQLEELVTSLRNINEAQEKAFTAAGKANTDLQHRLNVVAAEWAEQAETIRRLQIELDAAQQVPQAIADRFEEGWNQGTARAVETVLEWLQPIRAVDNEHLSNETLQHLPQIMRHLTGLAQD